MTNDDSQKGPSRGQRPNNPGEDETTPRGGRREPAFSNFDEDDDYEESDRDTDYASAYEEESDEDEFLDTLDDEGMDEAMTDWQSLPTGLAVGKNPWDVAESADAGDDTPIPKPLPFPVSPQPEAETEQLDEEFEEDDDDEDWDDQDDQDDMSDDEEEADGYEEPDEYEDEPPATGQRWPLGQIVVAIVALVLLVAGGYGVIQQRAATQEEIRQLQASLATAASPAEVAASREALRAMEQRNADNEIRIDALTLENRRLVDTVAGLENQQKAQQQATPPAAKPAPAAVEPATRPASKPAAAPKPAATTAAGDGSWFVNFSSYTQRSVAENWAARLKPSAGKAIVATASKDGKTFYRVRIVGLNDRSQAQQVAGQLQDAHKLPKLWVGKD